MIHYKFKLKIYNILIILSCHFIGQRFWKINEESTKSFMKKIKTLPSSLSIHSLNAEEPVKKPSKTHFETYFKLNYPWQSVHLPDNVDAALEEVNIYNFWKKIKKVDNYILTAAVFDSTKFYTHLVQVL